MSILSFFDFNYGLFMGLWSIFQLALLIIVVYFIYKSITRSLKLKEEHNDLLRQIIDKLGDKS